MVSIIQATFIAVVVICVLACVALIVYYKLKFARQWFLRKTVTDWNLKELLERIQDLLQEKRFSLKKHTRNFGLIDVPVFYINLSRSTSRDAFMRSQFEAFDVPQFHRCEAIDGQQHITNIESGRLNIDTEDSLTYENFNKGLSSAELACTLSHIMAIKRAYEEGLPKAVIMEDDCSFILLPYWRVKRISDLTKEVSADWKVIQLFSLNYESTKPVEIGSNDDCYSAACYMISRDGMRTILHECGFFGLSRKIHLKNQDAKCRHGGAADRFLFTNVGTPRYVVGNGFFLTQNQEHRSTIHDDHTNGQLRWVDKAIKQLAPFNKQLRWPANILKQSYFARALLDMDAFLKKRNVKYHLHSGTLLGAWRENAFIDFDDDIDLGVFQNDYRDNISESDVNIIFLTMIGQSFSSGAEFKFKHKPTGISIDIFVVYTSPDNTFMWYPSFLGKCNRSSLKMCRWRLPKYTTTPLDFLGRTFNVPVDTELILQFMYGDNWNIPHEYGYFQGLNNDLYNGLILSDFPGEEDQQHVEVIRRDVWCPRKLRSVSKPILWMYWQNKSQADTKPEYLDLCFETISKYCADNFEIIVLNDSLIPAVSRIIHRDFANINPIAMRADYIRFCIIQEFGGVWIDSDMIVRGDISFLINDLKTYEFVAFSHETMFDFGIGIFAGNKGNRVCSYAKYIFETDGRYNGWMSKPFTIDWASPTDDVADFTANMYASYPLEFKSYNAVESIYPIHYSNSKEFFWSEGNAEDDDDIITPKFVVVTLHNNMYGPEQKKMSKNDIMNSNLRIARVLRKTLNL